MIDLEKYGFIGVGDDNWELPSTDIRIIKHNNFFRFMWEDIDGIWRTIVMDVVLKTDDDLKWIVSHCPCLERIATNEFPIVL